MTAAQSCAKKIRAMLTVKLGDRRIPPNEHADIENQASSIIQHCIDQSLAPYREWVLNKARHWPVCSGIDDYGEERTCCCGLDKLKEKLNEPV